jgi:regulator of PEP synthase PpsR (kinase-PPPase family)
MTRSIFFVSDRTGISAEMLGQSLITQFDTVEFRRQTLPFVDTPEKAQTAIDTIHRAGREDGFRPIVFSTLIQDDIRDMIRGTDALVLDFFEIFIAPLEAELETASSHAVGRSHSKEKKDYTRRIDAIHFSLAHDDGAKARGLEEADLILVGISRSGKTPTSLYLAVQFGIKCANYPLIPEDLEKQKLPEILQPYRRKLWGLTIRAERLHQIRSERRPDSSYASLSNCRHEIQQAETILRTNGIPFLESTNRSIEELATTILHETGMARHIF